MQTEVTVDERRSHLEPAANHCGGEEKNKVAKTDDFNYLILCEFFGLPRLRPKTVRYAKSKIVCVSVSPNFLRASS